MNKIRGYILDFLIYMIQKIEPCKSRFLAKKLHQLADSYDPKPTREWNNHD